MKNIIPCLDVKNGKVVKGINFEGMREMGNPAEMAKYYSDAGADELVFLDITATTEGRETIVDLVAEVAKGVTVPFTVGGGVQAIEDIDRLLQAGASKVGINSAAVSNPQLIQDAAKRFGSEKIVAAVDAKNFSDGTWHVMTRGGMKDAEIDAIEWVKELEKLGAGSILLTSVDRDGVKDGYDLELTKAVVDAINIPVIASGGCGTIEHIVEVFKETNCQSALAASIFHEKTVTIKEVKQRCKEEGVDIA